MRKGLIEETLKHTTMVGSGTLQRIEDALVFTNHVVGKVVELGCFKGRTTRFICETLEDIGSQREVHVYDSFCGFPVGDKMDEGSTVALPKGGCSASMNDFMETFKGSDVKLPFPHPGWFEDTLPHLPSPISVAFLDSDRYSSMSLSITSVAPLMSEGGIIVMHGYEDCPGARLAIEENMDKYATYEIHGNTFVAKL